ncbi:MAG: DUF1850 domain-containing protein [Candidatus Rokubacteria bacterium]|nr:DUF1850 domain-containing protein [Candidatus Rokubacteria bacterium]
MTRRPRWIWRALVGGLILGLPAGALLFVRVPVLTVVDVKADRRIFALQVLAGESVVVSYRHSVTQGLVSGTFEVESDGALSLRETTFGSPGPGLPDPRPGEQYEIAGGVIRQRSSGERLRELSVFVHPFTDHTLVVKGKSLNISQEIRSAGLVKIRVERQFWWQRGIQKWREKLGGARLRT